MNAILGILIFSFSAYAKDPSTSKSTTLIVCTVNAECANIVNEFGGKSATLINLPKTVARRFFALSTIGERPVYLLQALMGGYDLDEQLKSTQKTIKWLEARGHRISQLVGFGTAGGNSTKLSPGDVVVQRKFDYKVIGNGRRFARAGKTLSFSGPTRLPSSTRSLLATPYNPTPRVVQGRCLTVNEFVSKADKLKHKEKCFQRNDYATARLAADLGIDFFAVRVISDTDRVPESFEQSKKAEKLWESLTKAKLRDPYCSDCDFYLTFQGYYLVNAAKTLHRILSAQANH